MGGSTYLLGVCWMGVTYIASRTTLERERYRARGEGVGTLSFLVVEKDDGILRIKGCWSIYARRCWQSSQRLLFGLCSWLAISSSNIRVSTCGRELVSGWHNCSLVSSRICAV